MSLKLAKQLGEIWKQFSTRQRAFVLVTTFGMVAGFATLAFWSSYEKNGLLVGNNAHPEASGVITALAALEVAQTRMNVLSQNIANANAFGPDGKPYQRQVVVIAPAPQPALNGGAPWQLPVLRVARIESDLRPGESIYAPGHPNADERGMITMPNISLTEELAEMENATRSFEANLTVVKKYARAMSLQTLAMGGHQ